LNALGRLDYSIGRENSLSHQWTAVLSLRIGQSKKESQQLFHFLWNMALGRGAFISCINHDID
jgi:hypothetical protein